MSRKLKMRRSDPCRFESGHRYHDAADNMVSAAAFFKAAPTSFAQLLSKSQASALSCDLRPQPAAASYNRHSINVNRGQDLEQKMTGFPNFDLILLSIRYSCSKILVSKRRKRRRQAWLCRVSAKYSADFSIKTVILNQGIYGTKYSRTAAWRP